MCTPNTRKFLTDWWSAWVQKACADCTTALKEVIPKRGFYILQDGDPEAVEMSRDRKRAARNPSVSAKEPSREAAVARVSAIASGFAN
jgi:hypothetical protein